MNDLKTYIQEIIQVINDDALFSKRDIPGDVDNADAISEDPGKVRHDMYEAINKLISAYDMIGDDYGDQEVILIVSEIKSAVNKLKSKLE